MNIVQTAEIHFYDQEKVSLYLQSNSSDQVEKLGEIALGAFYGVRMMSNLGHGDPSDRIAMLLELFPSTARQFAEGSVIGNLNLIEYPGYDGRSQSLLDLRMIDGGVEFRVEPGVGFYAPASVLALEFHLARRRWSDPAFLRALSTTLAACAALYRRDMIRRHNHAQLILPILAHCCPEYSGSLG